MKKRAALLLCAAALMLTLCSCGPAPVAVDDGSAYDGPTGGGYDYDKGYGYTAPEPGQSFSDYVKEQDPELYDSMTDIYDSAFDDDSYDYDKGYGYTAPEPGQSFSDYVKEQDPELYESLFN